MGSSRLVHRSNMQTTCASIVHVLRPRRSDKDVLLEHAKPKKLTLVMLPDLILVKTRPGMDCRSQLQ